MRTVILPFSKYKPAGELFDIKPAGEQSLFQFAYHDEVGNNLIALDATRRKLLYAKRGQKRSSCLLVDLNDLQSCSIKKEYSSINAGELKKNKLHHFLKSVFLDLVFKNGPGKLSLRLFDRRNINSINTDELEKQAKKWESILLQLVPMKVKESA